MSRNPVKDDNGRRKYTYIRRKLSINAEKIYENSNSSIWQKEAPSILMGKNSGAIAVVIVDEFEGCFFFFLAPPIKKKKKGTN